MPRPGKESRLLPRYSENIFHSYLFSAEAFLRVGSRSVPNLEPVFPVSTHTHTHKEPVHVKEKWFQSGTRALPGQKERTAYVRGWGWGWG